jgi:N-acetylneuraminic acid mutarotase
MLGTLASMDLTLVSSFVCDSQLCSGIDDVRGMSGNLQDVFVYDVETDTWSQVADFPYRAHHPYQFGLDNKVYILGGHGGAVLSNKTHYHDARVDKWIEVAEIPGLPRAAGSQFTYKSFGCIIAGEGVDDGGQDLDGYANSMNATNEREHHRSFPTSEFFCYVPDKDVWVTLPPAPGRSRWVPTTFVLDDYLYYVQGPIRQGLGESYSQTWPTQGYRISLKEVEVYIEEITGSTLSPTSAPASGATSINALVGLVLSVAVMMLGAGKSSPRCGAIRDNRCCCHC